MRLSPRLGSFSALLALAMAVSACSPPPQADRSSAPGSSATASAGTGSAGTGKGASGGRLSVARSGDIDNLDPHLATAFQTLEALELVYDTLLELDPQQNVQPGLATKWEYTNGGKTLTLTLREGVKFHDGDAFDSGDVKASIERILDEKTGGVVRTNLLSINDVQTPGPNTVVLALSEADGTLPAALTSLNTAMISDAALKAGTVNNKPNGTGPFRFGKWAQGQSLALEANKDYWGDGPFVDGVDIRVVPEESSILAGLRAKQYSIGIIGDPAVIKQVGGGLKVERTPELGYFPFFLNSERGPLKDKRVRQAIACGVDRQQIADAAVFGEGEPTGPFASPTIEAGVFDGLPCDKTDPALAKKLLAEANYADGFSIETIAIQGENTAAINVGQSLQAQLEKIGVRLKLVPLETNVYVKRWLKADFESALSANGASVDPQITYAKYFTSKGNFQNVAKLSSERLDQLFATGKATTDPQERAKTYAEISKLLLEESPWVWLFTGYKYQVLQPEVSGFVPTRTGSLKSFREVRIGS